MGQTLSNITIVGVWTMESTSGTTYFERLRVGAGSPNNATGLNDLYITSGLEVGGTIHQRGSQEVKVASKGIVGIDNVAHCYGIGQGVVGAATWYTIYRSTNNAEAIRQRKKMTYNPSSGIEVEGVAGNYLSATRMDDWLVAPLSTASAGGGMVSLSNPYGSPAVILEAILDVQVASTSALDADFGVNSGAALTGVNVFSGVPISNAACITTHGSGASGAHRGNGVSWPAAHFFTGTASAVGATSVSGYISLRVKRRN
jgi:hypothetical protein